ncbi:beta-glucosidase BglX [Phenylobacterium sp. LjRoot219]|uniref:beta-glucosidase BglX n=1 Tax=Phenylobacterium sp. LjRoot219 TaxID=3342283 RepID=UPI003ECE8655
MNLRAGSFAMAAGASRRRFLQASVAVATLAAASPARAAHRAMQADPFIETLIGAMSLADKAGQLTLTAGLGIGRRLNPGAEPGATPEQVRRNIAAGRVSGYFNVFDLDACRAMQKVAVERSPHRIPLIFAGDVIHGLRTAYPVPLGEAASFDPELCRRTARATAVEATALGVQWTFAPMVDVARDQRWGRVAEGAGEDTWLGGLLGAARVRGFQGSDLRAEDSLLACPKHFAGYGAVQGGMEYNAVDIPETTLREVHLPPFKAAFDAGAIATMSAFNEVAGVPATGNRHLLTEILRDEWGFPGLVVSDFTSEKELIAHGFAADEPDAVLKALSAGCDMAMQSGLYLKHIPDLARSGRLPQGVVDEAVRRVFRVKKALGLFDNPYRSLDPARAATDVRRPEFVALAREAGRKSLVLLKNDADLLPLPKAGKAIALIGPFVADRLDALGPWMVVPDFAAAVTLEEGFRAAMGPEARLTVVPGCGVEAATPGGIEAAVAAAQAADVVVLYLGESADMSGEAASRVDIGIPAPQLALAEAVAAVGKPVVVLLKHGRALALSGAVKDAPAILCTWFLGSESGHAIADVVFGDHAPQGRLPVSFPQASGQQPFYYNHRSTGRPEPPDDGRFKARYREVSNAALYPFGHGLGYSTVVYGPTEVGAPELARGGALKVTATVANTGSRAQHEVVQLYIHDKAASLVQPVRALKGVQHLDLAPGQRAVVEFVLSERDLAFVRADLATAAEPGSFEVWIAPSATTGTPATFALAG